MRVCSKYIYMVRILALLGGKTQLAFVFFMEISGQNTLI